MLPNKKIQRITVTVLYFIIMGLIITTKMAQEAELSRVIRSPRTVSLPNSKLPLYLSIRKAPVIARIRPLTLISVIRSLRTIKVNRNTMMGFDIIMMEELIGVVILRPHIKKTWFTTTPKSASQVILIIS